MTPSALHVAIIMDGNGRWAASRGLARTAGHEAGGEAVRRIVEAAPGVGVTDLTLYAFSSDNWGRPPAEVSALLRQLQEYLRKEISRCAQHGVRVEVIGRRDRLPVPLQATIQFAEYKTAHAGKLRLRLAIDYSSRWAIEQKVAIPDVDLLIRTGGEQRLSDFLLWESAYAELLFVKKPWPDFTAADLEAAVSEFYSRERRFGQLPAAG
ncbi:MAG: di-trans,poly-cis-decaprenylcistransferase [Acidobacteria bacterium]|nr:di-trans,poly-cis-decaprenylcistransferase [Acidobacteriota bacterium]